MPFNCIYTGCKQVIKKKWLILINLLLFFVNKLNLIFISVEIIELL